jgi:hypothetical protein
MRKHIVVEGMDGSGKDTLIDSLRLFFPDHTMHRRASTSLGGPVADIAAWTAADIRTMEAQPKSIYNRHPIISEPIYANYRTVKPGLRPPWDNSVWVGTYMRLAAKEVVVVVCQPTFEVVRDNLKRSGPDAHMPGVFENMRYLYQAYADLVWPGACIRYDYKASSVEPLVSLIRKQMNNG